MSESQFCLTSNEELYEDATWRYVFAVLIIFNVIGIVGVSVLIFLETRTKVKYHRVKETPPKLILTREYLEKLRPPKRSTPQTDLNTIPSIPSHPSASNDAAGAGEAATPKTNLLDPSQEKKSAEKK